MPSCSFPRPCVCDRCSGVRCFIWDKMWSIASGWCESFVGGGGVCAMGLLGKGQVIVRGYDAVLLNLSCRNNECKL